MDLGSVTPALTMVIADDHPVVRAGIRSLLAETPLRIVGESGSLRQTVDQVGTHRPSVLLLDLSFAGISSLQILPSVQSLSAHTRVLMLTMHSDLETARACLTAGAHGFLRKDAAFDELLTAVATIAARGRYLDPTLGAALLDNGASSDGALSTRERQVLTLIAEGLTNQQIAYRLNLSVRTVEAQRASIKVKLGVNRRAELVICARRLRLTA